MSKLYALVLPGGRAGGAVGAHTASTYNVFCVFLTVDGAYPQTPTQVKFSDPNFLLAQSVPL